MFLRRLCAFCLMFLAAVAMHSQTHAPRKHAARTAPGDATAVLLSDLHFDPFHDPVKFPRLLAAGAADWATVLAAPDSAGMAEATARLNAACPLRGVDTPPALLRSALGAAHHAAPEALFGMVAGDLLAHEFDCRFKTLAPNSTPAQYSAFATKTAVYVALELRHAFGATPVYVALGNNDSGCGDYRESTNSAFLQALAQSLAGEISPPAKSRSGSDKVFASTFARDGSYSVRLPAGIARGRLIVLQDLFESAAYKDCSNQPNKAAPAAQIAWLRAQLEAARAAHEQVWVMAHIPPSVNVYTTFAQKRDVCAGAQPVMFLANDELAHALTSYADVVRLAVFAHTHNDEIELLRPDPADTSPGSLAGAVAVKLTPSVSPVNGNMPAFTVAEVNRATAVMDDYRVVMASNQTGIATQWADEYRFSKLYGMTGYTAANVTTLTDAFVADKAGGSPLSGSYALMFFPGGGKGTLGVHLLWPQYSCGNQNHTAATYRDCACGAK